MFWVFSSQIALILSRRIFNWEQLRYTFFQLNVTLLLCKLNYTCRFILQLLFYFSYANLSQKTKQTQFNWPTNRPSIFFFFFLWKSKLTILFFLGLMIWNNLDLTWYKIVAYVQEFQKSTSFKNRYIGKTEKCNTKVSVNISINQYVNSCTSVLVIRRIIELIHPYIQGWIKK